MYRSLALLFMATMLLVSAPSLDAQVVPAGRDFSLPRAEVSLAYSPTEVNAPPGQCGCFFMNGGIQPNIGEPQPGEALYFESGGNDLVTSPLISVERPQRDVVQSYLDRR